LGEKISPHKWAYNFAWMGRPAIQFPNDAWAMQEIIWEVRPDLIIETGIAHGGSLVFSASMLALLDMSDAIESGQTMDPKVSRRKVLRRGHRHSHSQSGWRLKAHPMASRIQMIQGSSIATETIEQVRKIAAGIRECSSA